MITRIINFIKNRFAPRGAKLSFSQAGEDIIVDEFLKKLQITKPLYIDIGAHHPIFSNNTYLFYKKGGSGVIVEPNKSLSKLAEKKRPRDIILCSGAGRNNSSSTFYNFPQTTRSTFSEKQSKDWEKASGQKPKTEIIPIFSLDTIIKENFPQNGPDLISIDAEGYDIEILSGYSFKFRPKIFCVETLEPNGRNKEIYSLFLNNDYYPYAETPANTLFADRKIFNNKK
jgi:FkbM family methyltransferase